MRKYIPISLVFIFHLSMAQVPGKSNDASVMRWTAQFPHAVVYQVFTRSFADGNGDGIGDIEGIRKKLPYLQELGIGAIWLTPVFESPSYHKYDISNYFNVDKECGSSAELKRLVDDAHQRNIKVILDFVANHTSTQHEWFKEAVKGNPEYKNFYIWSSDTSEWKKEPDHWHWVDAKKRGPEKYYGFFWRGMPDLNYDNDSVCTKIIEAACYWITTCDIDGYRLDAASLIYPYEQRAKNYLWWKQFAGAVRATKPGFYLVGEMWGGDTLIAPYLKAGLNAGFNFDLWFNIKASLKEEQDLLSTKLLEAYKKYAGSNINFNDAIILSNHDNPRIMDEVNGSIAKAKQAAAILFTLPYTPYVYYGDELGMYGPKPDEHIREPFLWGSADEANCTWEPNYHNKKTKAYPTQTTDANSIYNTYKNLIHLRNNDEVLSDDIFLESPVKKLGMLGYVRQAGTKQYLVLHNLTGKKMDIDISSFSTAGSIEIVFKSNDHLIIKGNKISLSKYSSVVIANGE